MYIISRDRMLYHIYMYFINCRDADFPVLQSVKMHTKRVVGLLYIVSELLIAFAGLCDSEAHLSHTTNMQFMCGNAA